MFILRMFGFDVDEKPSSSRNKDYARIERDSSSISEIEKYRKGRE